MEISPRSFMRNRKIHVKCLKQSMILRQHLRNMSRQELDGKLEKLGWGWVGSIF